MSDRRGGFGLVGIGIAGCAACCAPPLVAALVGLGGAALAGVLFGLLGATGAAVATAGWVMLRRRRQVAHLGAAPEAVSVPDPTRRAR